METVYSMIIDRMQADADLRLFAVISTMARQGVIEVEVAERVWKERKKRHPREYHSYEVSEQQRDAQRHASPVDA